TFTTGAAPWSTFAQQRETAGASGTLDSYVFLDGFGRTIETKKEAAISGHWIATDTYYDGLGRRQSASVFYDTSTSALSLDGSQKQTAFTYDALDRPTEVTATDGTISTSVYDRWTTTTHDANDHQKVMVKDAYGRIAQVQEINGGSTYTTNYVYNNGTGEL